MKHLDLFSGIGGFALAAQRTWGDEYENIGFCDIEPFSQKILKLRFPNSQIYGDIRTITNIGHVDIITGGFPCQPFSIAGKRKGTDDNRHLWPEMYRVIKECTPDWVVGENVRGLLNIDGGMVFESVCTDLEAIGYKVQPFIIPACGVGAPHRRDRVWIIAHRDIGWIQRYERTGIEERPITCGCTECIIANARQFATRGAQGGFGGGKQPDTPTGIGANSRDGFTNESWDRNWLEVATELCGMDDGFPATLDGRKLSKAQHRTARLKALGNAIVPQVAQQIMQAIKTINSI